MQKKFTYTIIRSKRRSISIEITPEASVIVRAPLYLPERKIKEFVNEKSGWIETHIEATECAQKELGIQTKLTQTEIDELTEKAKAIIPQRCAYYAKLLGVEYNRITIRHQKTKWGSCSSKKNLNFNCLLMLAPSEVLDAIVVHELCHLKHMNHSKAFYNEILKVYPDYRKWNKWLKKNGAVLLKRL